MMVDGVHFGDHLCVVALGIGIDGTKVPLALVEGSTENTTTVTDLLVGMRERGLDTSKPILVGIDGAKALAAAVKRVFDHPVIQRCQLHKQRNVTDRLPGDLGAVVGQRMPRADHPDTASAQLEALARALERTHPGAAGSLREGLQETLTVLRLNVPPSLARTLRSTTAIESMISIARTHSRNVNNPAERETRRGRFRRINGHLHLATLRTARNEQVAAMTVGAVSHDEPVIAA